MKMMKQLLNKFKTFFEVEEIPEKNKTYRICTDSKYYENSKLSIAIELISGKYEDVIFGISSINVGDTLEDGSAKATFDLEILFQPSSITENLTEDDKFNKIVCDILLQVIAEAIKNAEERMNELLQEPIEGNDEIRNDGTDYFEEPVQKRAVRKKNPSVPKKRIFSRKKS